MTIPSITPADLFAISGVSLLLFAFVLNLVGTLVREDWRYLALNAIGASLACVGAALIPFLPFVVLEGTWAVVSVWQLGRLALR